MPLPITSSKNQNQKHPEALTHTHFRDGKILFTQQEIEVAIQKAEVRRGARASFRQRNKETAPHQERSGQVEGETSTCLF